jgi:hypothetical protein
MKTSLWHLALLVTALGTTPLALVAGCGGEQKPGTVIPKPGEMPEGGSWTGVFFNSQFGMLHMQETSEKIVGKWKTAEGSAWGELNGEVHGNVVRFEWTEHKIGLVGPSATSHGKGFFVYKRPTGENVDDALDGEWGLNNAETGNKWDCVKQRNMKPDLASIGGQAEATSPASWK